MKDAKILSITYDNNNLQLIVDVRVSVPKTDMSEEFITDVLQMKKQLIDGTDDFEYKISIDSPNDKNILIFKKILKAPVA